MTRVDQLLAELAAEVVAGRYVESPLELLRLVHLGGIAEAIAVRALIAGCGRHGLAFSIVKRQAGAVSTKYIVFRAA